MEGSFRMGKLGRKIRCEFNPNVKCILLLGNEKHCLIEETTEKQFFAKHEIQFAFCPFLPEFARLEFLATLEKECFFEFRSFYT